MHIEVDGNEYPLRYSLRALKKFEQKTKISVFALGNANALTAEACTWLIYVGIVDGCDFEGIEFKKSLQDIEPYVDLGHVQVAVQALQEYTGENEKKAKTSR
jgi:hypothetical protein